MEIQIQELVQSLRRDGIEAARQEQERILSEAKAEAKNIVAQAQQEAKQIMDASRQEIRIERQSAADDAKQAVRDALLAFKQEVQTQIDLLLAAKIQEELSGPALTELIRAAIAGEDLSCCEVQLNTVSDQLRADLAQEIRMGLEIRPNKAISCGFRVAEKDGSGYLDCSDEEIMQILQPYFRSLAR